ncbi:hypothetical protein GGR57DRAFT_78523 [Xylariaceae sp. FL1272]|nr:hypothetical protein GGR57DRAFT_78523 [Xylariaceae sp. FL1272]
MLNSASFLLATCKPALSTTSTSHVCFPPSVSGFTAAGLKQRAHTCIPAVVESWLPPFRLTLATPTLPKLLNTLSRVNLDVVVCAYNIPLSPSHQSRQVQCSLCRRDCTWRYLYTHHNLCPAVKSPLRLKIDSGGSEAQTSPKHRLRRSICPPSQGRRRQQL